MANLVEEFFGINKNEALESIVFTKVSGSESGNLTSDQFSSMINYNKGLARTNRFLVRIITPKVIRNANLLGDKQNFETMSFICEKIDLPDHNFDTITYRDNLNQKELPVGYTNKPIRASFLVTQNYLPRQLFNVWSANIVNKKRYRIAYKDDFTTTIYITALNTRNQPVHGVVLEKAFPRVIGDLKFSNTEDNRYMTLDVLFSYDDFEEYSITYPPEGTDSALFVLDGLLSNRFFDDVAIGFERRISESFDKKFFALQDKVEGIPLIGGFLSETLGLSDIRQSIGGGISDIFGDITSAVRSPINDVISEIRSPIDQVRSEVSSTINEGKDYLYKQATQGRDYVFSEAKEIKNDIFSSFSKTNEKANVGEKSSSSLFSF